MGSHDNLYKLFFLNNLNHIFSFSVSYAELQSQNYLIYSKKLFYHNIRDSNKIKPKSTGKMAIQ